MKHKVSLLAVLLMAMALPQVANAYDFSAVAPSGQTLYYNIVDGHAEVTYQFDTYNMHFAINPTGALVIPDSVTWNGTTYPVTHIGGGVFSGCNGLTSLVIGDVLTIIGHQSFKDCTGLTSVVIGNAVTQVGSYSFWMCTNLASLTLGSAVTVIGEGAFEECNGLTSVVIPNSVTNIGANAFSDCPNLTSVSIGSRVVSIEINFQDCDNLTTITVDTANTHYDSRDNCNAVIETATNTLVRGCAGTIIPSTVTSIGNYAFSSSGLTSIVIPESVTGIGTSAFSGCYSLTSVTIGTSGTNPNPNTVIGANAFRSCNALTSVFIGNSVVFIGSEAFWNCSNLSSLTIGNAVASIGYSAFIECSSLTSVVLPNSVTNIGEGAFAYCSSLTSVNIPNSLTSIGDYAFDNCSNLTSIIIPDWVTSIGMGAFEDCGLTSLHIGSGVASMGLADGIGSPFSGCGNLATITVDPANTHYDSRNNCNAIIETATNTLLQGCENTVIPPSITSIGIQAFRGCTGLTSITIPDSVTSIGHQAFSGCSGLTSITIPSSVTSFGNCVFKDCNNLASIVFLPETPPSGMNYLIYFYIYWSPICYVRCGCLPAYQVYSSIGYNFVEMDADLDLTLAVNDSLLGTAEIVLQDGHRVLCDSSAIILATAEEHYHFDHWSNGSTANPDTLYLTGDSNIMAFFAPNRYSVVGTSYYTARGAVYGSDTVDYLDTVTLVAVPNYGYHMNYWRYTNDEGNYQNLYDVDTLRLAATRDKTATAYFAPNQYTITLSVDTSIHGTVTGGGTYNYLANRIIRATANYGYHFLQWSDGNTDNPRTLSLTQDTVLTAMFAPNEYTLTITSNDETIGTVTGDGVYEYLDTVQLTATVTAAHHHFVRWNDGVTESTRTVTILSDSSFTAFFAIDTHSVAATVNNDNYGHVTGAGNYPYGTEVTLEAVPEEGYYFVKWTNESTDNPATFTMTDDTTLSAIFSDDVTPNLCMVSVQNNRNVVIWTKEMEVVEYKIYREGNTTSNYDLVATVPYSAQSTWTDQESRPMSRSYRYKMTAVDSWGNETPFSDVHKTIHLIISQGMGNQWNLQWNEYEGAEFITYMIYRGNQWGNLQLIGQMSVGGNNSYTDENAPAGSVYYQVVVVKSTPCNITKSESLIYSNVATNDEVGITDVAAYDVNVYAADGRIIVEGAEGKEVRVYDMMGREVRNEALSAGVYMVRVGDLPARKVVVVR